MKANENSRIALFTGTFDPFTTGHASVVRRALPLFDHLVIAVAVSERKHTQEEISERVAAIASLYEDDPRVSETVLLFTEPDLQSVSSTLVRELRFFGHDASQFIPKK